MSELLSINEAAAQGISLLRSPKWALPDDYIKIDIIDGKPGPWLHLYSTMNEGMNGRNPVDYVGIGVDYDEKKWEAYSK